MRMIPARLWKYWMQFVFLFLRAETLTCNGRNTPGCATVHSGAVPEHSISFHSQLTAQTFIQHMSCLLSSLLGSYTIYSLMHSHLIPAFLFKCSFIYCGEKKKTSSVQGDCWERNPEWFCHSHSDILCLLVPKTGTGGHCWGFLQVFI